MKQVWTVDELGECWTLSVDEFAFVERRRQADGRLGIAHQIKHYQHYARFIDSDRDVPADVTEYLIDQIGDGTAKLDTYDWNGRSGRRHRLEILKFLGVRLFDDAADADLRAWLIDTALPSAPNAESLSDQITGWLLANRVERPNAYQLDRKIASATHEHEKRLFANVSKELTADTRIRLDALLTEDNGTTPFGPVPT